MESISHRRVRKENGEGIELRRKDRPRLLKERPLRSFLGERSTLIIERPLLGSGSSVKESVEHKRIGPRSVGRQEPSKEVSGFVAHATPKSHTHLSYEGQSELSYCVECGVKHSQTAKVLMREAIQRAEAASPSSIGVMEKVRGVVEELCGFEDDTEQTGPDQNMEVTSLNTAARSLRKFIYTTRAEVGGASLEDLHEIKSMVDKLVDKTYRVRLNEQCIGCTVEELCGGNLECVEFVERAASSVKDPAEFQRVLSEARERYGR